MHILVASWKGILFTTNIDCVSIHTYFDANWATDVYDKWFIFYYFYGGNRNIWTLSSIMSKIFIARFEFFDWENQFDYIIMIK
jgi:hypothetical protein